MSLKKMLLLTCVLAMSAGLAMADDFMGVYVGKYEPTGRGAYPARALVIPEGPGLYRLLASYDSPHPDELPLQIEIHGNAEGPKVKFYGHAQTRRWFADLQDGKLTIRRDHEGYGGAFTLEKTIEHSPTEGMAPPEGAVVLLPYAEGKMTDTAAWTNQEWEAKEDGSMEVEPHSGDNRTKQEFGDSRIHFEFKLPLMAHDFDQGRANSGIYIQDRYECQILDSFGVIPGDGDCGSFYHVATTRVNASYPPLQWQTYDI